MHRKEEILGTWYGTLMYAQGKWHYVTKTDEEAEVLMEFREDGSVWVLLGNHMKDNAYDYNGTWSLKELYVSGDIMLFAYQVELPDGVHGLTIQAFKENGFGTFPEVTIPAGFTLIGHRDDRGFPWKMMTVYTRERQY